ncbi:TFIID-31kDa-domain-containing protein [Lindgomyces ingoldianus]|uniref:TFIID-31kDa-domain-containing protein n=1 Tax=Lindgomyces ingoldianus TaxID=673940 RepID=A0ACB6RAN6_9PLEO|nr:TFIID-31kDa-domain-containing protein [Lindgomyces ingoldianus]KAF2476115.1 TFIID-31kDa-domain-containing protein [Lindgomyces ingoldianus]
MASPAAADLPNGISTPPTTATGAPNPSPPTASSTQAATQPQSQSQSQLSKGQTVAQINPAHPLTSLQDSGMTKRPRDARLIHLLLANMGVHAYTERVPLQLLDFAYRYTSGILSDAIAYEPPLHQSTSSKKAAKEDDGISLNALRTAVGARVAQQFSPALPKEFMMEVASERNKIALPRVEREFGVRLPPERYCFTGVGWSVKESWESEGEEDEGLEGSGVGAGGPVGDVPMGGMEEEDVDEDQFEEVMGLRGGDAEMADG